MVEPSNVRYLTEMLLVDDTVTVPITRNLQTEPYFLVVMMSRRFTTIHPKKVALSP